MTDSPSQRLSPPAEPQAVPPPSLPNAVGYRVVGNPPAASPLSCPAGLAPEQVGGQVLDDRILENHFFPGLVFEFRHTESRRLAGRRDLPHLAGLDARTPAPCPDNGDPLTEEDIADGTVLLCALSLTGRDEDFRFFSWHGNNRNIAAEAADAIRGMPRGFPTRVLLIRETLFRPRGQARVTAALAAYTGGRFSPDRIERHNGQFCWAVLSAPTRSLIDGRTGLVGFEGPPEAPTPVIAPGELQATLSSPWQAGQGICGPDPRPFERRPTAATSGNHDCIDYINGWEKTPVRAPN